MRTIIWFAYFWGYLVSLTPKLLRLEKQKERGEEFLPEVQQTVATWARRLMKLAGAEITVTGIENIPKDKPVLFVGNHSGYFDIPLLLAYLDNVYPIVAKKEISKFPLVNRWMKLFNCLFIDRSNPRQSLTVLSSAAKLVEAGQSVSIFPEGTRAKSRELGEFKSGAFRIAEKTKSAVVPLAITGTRDLMENNSYFIRPGKVSMKILPSIETNNLSKEELKALPEKVKLIIDKELGD